MFSRTSRYRNARHFEPDPEGRPMFQGVRARRVRTLEPVLEHQVAAGQRPDALAKFYYDDPEKWWLLLDANPEASTVDALFSPNEAGNVVLVPRDASDEFDS